jgi:hypothetical protein
MRKDVQSFCGMNTTSEILGQSVKLICKTARGLESSGGDCGKEEGGEAAKSSTLFVTGGTQTRQDITSISQRSEAVGTSAGLEITSAARPEVTTIPVFKCAVRSVG